MATWSRHDGWVGGNTLPIRMMLTVAERRRYQDWCEAVESLRLALASGNEPQAVQTPEQQKAAVETWRNRRQR